MLRLRRAAVTASRADRHQRVYGVEALEGRQLLSGIEGRTVPVVYDRIHGVHDGSYELRNGAAQTQSRAARRVAGPGQLTVLRQKLNNDLVPIEGNGTITPALGAALQADVTTVIDTASRRPSAMTLRSLTSQLPTLLAGLPLNATRFSGALQSVLSEEGVSPIIIGAIAGDASKFVNAPGITARQVDTVAADVVQILTLRARSL